MAKLKDLFTVLGVVKIVKDETGIDRHRFIPASPRYLSGMLSHVPADTKLACTFSKEIPTRSRAQLALHWVYMHYLGESSGYTDSEMHNIVMIECFGQKIAKFNGKDYLIRQSISDNAKMSKDDVSKLLEKDKELCDMVGVVLPTAQELGYLCDERGNIIK
jgi:hypothetical protein